MTDAMTTMPRYERYKDSGIDWLGNIPQNWEIKKVKFLFQLGRGRVISQQELDDDGLYPVYSSQTKNDGILGYISNFDFDCNQITWTTDGANAGTVFLRRGKHNCTNVCGTLKPISCDKLDLIYTLHSLSFSAQFYKRPDTNGAKIMNGEMANVFIAFPPLSEQKAIATFLDKKTAQIDQAINIKEQQITLLKERKQIIIQNAVTKGLDPNVPMKDSGVEWIGEIPAHWDVKKIKHYLKIKNGQDHKEVVSDDGQYPVFGSGGEFVKASEYLYRGEAILMGRKGTIDKPLHIDCAFWTVDTMFYGIPNNKCNTRFLYFCITQMPFAYYSTSTALPSMTQFDLNNNPVVNPPSEEQVAIVKYIENESKKIDASISAQQLQIDKLNEYKASLINSAVTGKIKVI